MDEKILAWITPVDQKLSPEHPIYKPTPPSDVHPSHPIVIPPNAIGPGVPTHPIFLPVYPEHPIVIPPDAIGPGQPSHPIYLPQPIHPSHPIVIPPDSIEPGVPTHPIYLPPPGMPTNPIALPPTGEGWKNVYILGLGWTWMKFAESSQDAT